MDSLPRLLTTEQLAQAFGITTNALLKSFRRHKDVFIEGKHYVFDEAILAFPNNDEAILASSKKGGSRRKYLWTPTGAFAHAKFLNSPRAWEAYEGMIELAEKPQGSHEEIAKLQLEISHLKQTVLELTAVPHLDNMIDYETLGDFEILMERIETEFEKIKNTTKDSEILNAIEHLRPLLRKAGNAIALNQHQLEQTDNKFIEQASALNFIDPALKLLN